MFQVLQGSDARLAIGVGMGNLVMKGCIGVGYFICAGAWYLEVLDSLLAGPGAHPAMWARATRTRMGSKGICHGEFLQV